MPVCNFKEEKIVSKRGSDSCNVDDYVGGIINGNFAPSNIRTAVGKSFTRRAARRAATMTEGAGTRS